MKKVYFVFLCGVVLFIVTGCAKGNKIVCSKSSTTEGIPIEIEITANLDEDNKISSVLTEYEFENKEIAENYCNSLKENNEKVKCSGRKLSIENDDESGNIIGTTRDEFINLANSEKYKCK